MAKDCPDCTEGKAEGPRCPLHEAEWCSYQIKCHFERLVEIVGEITNGSKESEN